MQDTGSKSLLFRPMNKNNFAELHLRNFSSWSIFVLISQVSIYMMQYRRPAVVACGLNQKLNYAQPRNDSSHLIKSLNSSSRISHICCKSIIMNVPSAVYGALLLGLASHSTLSKELLIQDITLTNLNQVTNSKFQMHQGRMLTIGNDDQEDLQDSGASKALRFLHY